MPKIIIFYTIRRELPLGAVLARFHLKLTSGLNTGFSVSREADEVIIRGISPWKTSAERLEGRCQTPLTNQLSAKELGLSNNLRSLRDGRSYC